VKNCYTATKLAPIRTPDPNQSTFVSCVHTNGRSLHTVDRHGGGGMECPTHCKNGGEIVQGRLSGGICPGEMSGSLPYIYSYLLTYLL